MTRAIFSAAIIALAASVSAKPSKTNTAKRDAQPTASAPPSAAMPQISPTFPNLVVDAGAPSTYTTGAAMATGALPSNVINLKGYPEQWKTPDVTSPEVVAAIANINMNLVPNAPVRTGSSGNLNMAGYDANKDEFCWWTASGCTIPKAAGLSADIYYCPTPKSWGLTYDDGPYVQADPSHPDPFAEPNLYNFLAQSNQKASLFYIGSNVVGAPQAAQRALADGHVICVHTWSHPAMTTLTNQQVVAEFYWTLKAIKEVLGITPKCWRPPYGDTDDRVRAIAWQMGMVTNLWDQDSNDWNMPGAGGGNLPPATVDGYFEGWIQGVTNGSDVSKGHVTLQHELNNATVAMAEKWLPKVQETYTGGVMPASACMNTSMPYWEQNWVYATAANPNVNLASAPVNSTGSTGASSTNLTTTSSSNSSSSPSSSANTSGGSSSTVNTAVALIVALGVIAASL